MPEQTGFVHETKILIVGTGGNAISIARSLKVAGIEDFTFISRNEEFGGTWVDARFPGAQVDQPVSLYSLSYAPNPYWSKPFPDAWELREYLAGIAAEYGLEAHAHWRVEMHDAHWDAASKRWYVDTTAGRYSAQYLVVVTGFLDEPKGVAFEGAEEYTGRVVQAARWPEDFDPAGQSIVVVGSGATAVEVIPELQRSARRLVSLQRSTTYVLPKPNDLFPEELKQARAADPRLMHVERARAFAEEEIMDPRAMGPHIAAQALEFLAQEVIDPELRRGLTPDHPWLCKRPLFSNVYLRTLTRPNDPVVFDAMEAFTPNGVRTASGREIEADAVVLTTGYHWGTHVLRRIHRGDGVSVAEHQAGWVRAYKGTNVAGCPNMFLVGGAGPNSQHGSGLFNGEATAPYVVLAIQEVERRGVESLEVSEEAEIAWKRRADHRNQDLPSVVGGCTNYSLDAFGNNMAVWPGTPTDMEYQHSHLIVEDYAFA